MIVGRVREIWRYPFKSMRGERLERSGVGSSGLFGDRGWAVRDERAGEIRGAKKLPGLLRCSAVYADAPGEHAVPDAEITFEDGRTMRTRDPALADALSALLGRPVTVWPKLPADNADHYRHGKPDHEDMETELRSVFGRTDSEPLPDFSVLGPDLLTELTEYTSPRGTYFDAFPVHILTTASIAEGERLAPGSSFDARRFRPNLTIETEPDQVGFVEHEWSGKTLKVGSAEFSVTIPCMRCVMTTLAQDGLPKDPKVLRTIVREAGQNLGAYADVARAGEISVGDAVELV